METNGMETVFAPVSNYFSPFRGEKKAKKWHHF